MRKTADVTITDEGRDKGKLFHLTEMPAAQTEWWAVRAFKLMAKAGMDFPDDVMNAGFAGIASLGLRALGGIDDKDLRPLLEEMMGCVQVVRDPKHPSVVQPLLDGDIEEVATRLQLRAEVWKLHAGFLQPGGRSTSTSATPGTA